MHVHVLLLPRLLALTRRDKLVLEAGVRRLEALEEVVVERARVLRPGAVSAITWLDAGNARKRPRGCGRQSQRTAGKGTAAAREWKRRALLRTTERTRSEPCAAHHIVP